MQDFLKTAKREWKTTVGRRRSSIITSATNHNNYIDQAPKNHPNEKVIIKETTDDGWDIVHKSQHGKHAAEVPPAETKTPYAYSHGPYLQGGEAGAMNEEDEEYRRIWNLPKPPVARACAHHEASSSSSRAAPPSRRSREAVKRMSVQVRVPSTEGDQAMQVLCDAPPGEVEGAANSLSAQSVATDKTQSNSIDMSLGTFGPSPGEVIDNGVNTGANCFVSAGVSRNIPRNLADDDDQVVDSGQEKWSADTVTDDSMKASEKVEKIADDVMEAHDSIGDVKSSILGVTSGATSRRLLDDHWEEDCFDDDWSEQDLESYRWLLPLRWPRFILLLSVRLIIGMSHGFWIVMSHIACGLLRAHHPVLVWNHSLQDSISRRCILQCILLNVCLFKGAIYFYESILPEIFRHTLQIEVAADAWYKWMVLLCWTIPAYLICEVISTYWHYRMYKQMSSRFKQKPSTTASIGISDTRFAASAKVVSPSAASSTQPPAILALVYTRLVYVAFLFQVRLFCALPVIGPAVTIILSALLHAYDSFEYCWDELGLGVAQRFRRIEAHWLFFLGYGCVLASLSVMLRFWDVFALRTVLYPVYIANAPHAHYDALRTRPLPFFGACFGVINSALQLAELRVRGGG